MIETQLNAKMQKILIADYGWIYSEDGPIEIVWKPGEMANVAWYKQGNKEFNGKYAIIIVYKEETQ